MNRDDRVERFEETELDTHELMWRPLEDEARHQSLGDPGIFAFAFDKRAISVGSRTEISPALQDWIDAGRTGDELFTALSIARFLRDDEQERIFAKELFENLSRESTDYALEWLADGALRPAVVDALYLALDVESGRNKLVAPIEETWVEIADVHPTANLQRLVFERAFERRRDLKQHMRRANALAREFQLESFRTRPASGSRRGIRNVYIGVEYSVLPQLERLAGTDRDTLRLGPLILRQDQHNLDLQRAAEELRNLGIPSDMSAVVVSRPSSVAAAQNTDAAVEALSSEGSRPWLVLLKQRSSPTSMRNFYSPIELHRGFKAAQRILVLPSGRPSKFQMLRSRPFPIVRYYLEATRIEQRLHLRKNSRVVLIGGFRGWDTRQQLLAAMRSMTREMRNDQLFLADATQIFVAHQGIGANDQHAIYDYLKQFAPEAKFDIIAARDDMRSSAGDVVPTILIAASGFRGGDRSRLFEQLCISTLEEQGWRVNRNRSWAQGDFQIVRGDSRYLLEVKTRSVGHKDWTALLGRRNEAVIITSGAIGPQTFIEAFAHGIYVIRLDDIEALATFDTAKWKLLLSAAEQVQPDRLLPLFAPLIARLVQSRVPTAELMDIRFQERTRRSLAFVADVEDTADSNRFVGSGQVGSYFVTFSERGWEIDGPSDGP